MEYGVPNPHGPDIREHAHYPDHKNDRAMVIESFRNIVSQDEVNRQLVSHLKKEKTENLRECRDPDTIILWQDYRYRSIGSGS
jgi:hypothetical protein